MSVRDWWMLLSFYQNVLVVPVALLLFILLVRAKTARRRALFGSLLVLAFLPHIQLWLGNWYFDYLCRTQAGEFIYRTVDNVDGILQMRPRDGSKDYFDRMAEGDIPEDPWGHTNRDAQRPWHMLNEFEFIEITVRGVTAPPESLKNIYDASMFREPPSGATIVRFFRNGGRDLGSLRKEFDQTHKSKYGFTWSDESTFLGWMLNVHEGEIRVVDLMSGEMLGKKVGFLRARPMSVCPEEKDDSLVEAFISRVLRPTSR